MDGPLKRDVGAVDWPFPSVARDPVLQICVSPARRPVRRSCKTLARLSTGLLSLLAGGTSGRFLRQDVPSRATKRPASEYVPRRRPDAGGDHPQSTRPGVGKGHVVPERYNAAYVYKTPERPGRRGVEGTQARRGGHRSERGARLVLAGGIPETARAKECVIWTRVSKLLVRGSVRSVGPGRVTAVELSGTAVDIWSVQPQVHRTVKELNPLLVSRLKLVHLADHPPVRHTRLGEMCQTPHEISLHFPEANPRGDVPSAIAP